MSADHGVVQPEEKKKNKKRAIVILAGIVAASGVGSLAFAYWTETGGGTGSASTGTTAHVTVTQTSTVTGLYPGATAALAGTINNGNSSSVKLAGGLDASVTDVTRAGSSIAGSCDPSWFTVTGGPVDVGSTVSGSGTLGFNGLTLTFTNLAGTNQDACKSATPVITYTVS